MNQIGIEICKQYPGVRKDVIEFITNIIDTKTYNKDEAIENFFACGYCYYFAMMLKSNFGGQIVWHLGYSHILWMDETGCAYDVHGVFTDYNDYELIPIYLVDDLDRKAYMHSETIALVDQLLSQRKTLDNVRNYYQNVLNLPDELIESKLAPLYERISTMLTKEDNK